jgi:hypothetical protein
MTHRAKLSSTEKALDGVKDPRGKNPGGCADKPLNNQDSQEKKKGKESVLRLDNAERKVKRRTRKRTGEKENRGPFPSPHKFPI